MNYSWITDNLAVGTTPDDDLDIKALVTAGITYFLNTRLDINIAPLLGPSRVWYCWDGTADWPVEHQPVPWFKAGLDFAVPAIKGDSKVYVFCHRGTARSPIMAYAILRALQPTLSPDDCRHLIEQHHPTSVFGFTMTDWREDAELALKALGYV
jgi:hypothetical protein